MKRLEQAPGDSRLEAAAAGLQAMVEDREAQRLYALKQLKLLDTPASESFDRISRMAGRIFDLPIAAVSLTDHDRQWFKSRVGVDHQTLPREGAPCAQVAESGDLLVINDLLADPVYAQSPLARSGVRFYAGAPLVTREGWGLGAMCVLGLEPREVTPDETGGLIDLAAMVMAQIELQHAFGRVDPLTGLPNQTQFVEDAEDLARDAAAGVTRLIVLVDLATSDQLTQMLRARGSDYLNDHVRRTSQLLAEALGDRAQLYHISNSQFAFLAPPGTMDAEYVSYLARRLADATRNSVSRFVATAAIGVAPFVLGESDPRDVLRAAFTAAGEARTSESRVSFYSSSLDLAQRRRHRLIDDFSRALDSREELRLVYQPRVDLASGRCVGVEALLRWAHPELGDVSPGEFMPLVEQTDLARPATEWVLKAALDQAAAWRRLGLGLVVSVNITATNLQEADFADRVRALTAGSGSQPSGLELELTESALIADAGRALAQLNALAGAGFSLAIDDFGTGYSSLSYLRTLPAKVVKIDQSFVRDMAKDPRRQSLVASMISLSHNLGYRVVAEGIETSEISDLLKAAGCDEAQGYHYGRPMPADAFEAWLRASTRAEPEPRARRLG